MSAPVFLMFAVAMGAFLVQGPDDGREALCVALGLALGGMFSPGGSWHRMLGALLRGLVGRPPRAAPPPEVPYRCRSCGRRFPWPVVRGAQVRCECGAEGQA